MNKSSQSLAALLASPLWVSVALATPPDAGQTLQQLQQEPPSLPKTDSLLITTPQTQIDTPPGGPKVAVSSIRFIGHTLFSDEQLIAVLGEQALGQAYDLAGLRQLAEQISQFYREQGYPFARAFIPAQNLTNGLLTIEVLEGRYGQVSVISEEEKLQRYAQRFLAGLVPDTVMESRALERATLILSDQPGIKVSPIIQPGSQTGSGDLMVDVQRDRLLSGSIGADNHGNRYTGKHKVKANLNLNSPFMLGDQFTLNVMASDYQDSSGLLFGGVGYNLPLNGDGLRANISYSHTYYQLGKDFKSIDADGVADTYLAGLSYPLMRSQKTNLNLSLSLQHKALNDDPGNQAARAKKNSVSVPLTLNFDTRDAFGGGAVTFGSISWTKGDLSLDNTLKAGDVNNTRGAFDRFNLDLARLQSLPSNLNLYVRGSVQWANKNLDSSEGFGIGGIAGVRAYPTGEGYGNVGWVTQTELRYNWSAYLSPYVFYDVGSSTANQTSVGDNPVKDLSGSGFGLRVNYKGWSADLAAAWRINGGRPADAKTPDETPRIWLSINYQL
ncbi:MAG: ShlB/FhaC/HecB family hemolysin secretion/activation protein [Thiomicrospira sp.]|jgi:hemolysin activation/secretion protein|nr:ShlB/FhaC/HecB family hemolysin secretion/activation protein [Thiomicrospira sp.]